ncbi:MAG: tyrosine-type recombinase/integrase [Acutalibacteraceae bacterium]
MTFKEVAEEWFFVSKSLVSYGYRVSIRNHLDKIYSFIGEKDILQIKPIDIDTIIISLAVKNPHTQTPTAKNTLKAVLQTINAIFEHALKNEYITKNPARFTKIPSKAPSSQRRALTPFEQALIVTVPHRAQTAAMIMLFAGLRRGEVIALKWSDIDFEHSAILVNKSAQKCAPNQFIIKDGTKNGKSRKVSMPSILCEYLKDQVSLAESCYICPDINGRLMTPSAWRKLWSSYLIELNHSLRLDLSRSKYNPHGVQIRLDNITAHMLRHTYATMLYSAGVDVKTAAKLLGHSNIETTLKIYTHLSREQETVSLEKFEAYINNHF